MTKRREALVPWYHKPKPRCDTTTLAGTQCTFSATYVSVKYPDLHFCQPHGKSAKDHLGKTLRVKLIPEDYIII